MSKITIDARVKGALYGVLVGDALGGPVQFKRRGTFEPVREFRYVQPFHQPKGSWSDDGSLTLCLAKSLFETNMAFSAADYVSKMVAWHSKGYMSSCGRAWDEGISTREALDIWKPLLRGSSNGAAKPDNLDMKAGQALVDTKLNFEHCSGNGSLMRVVPVGLALWQTEDAALTAAKEQSDLTHPSVLCSECCTLYTALVVAIMKGATKEDLIQILANADIKNKQIRERLGQYKTLADWKGKWVRDVKTSGFVLDTLEAALWGLFNHEDWLSGALDLVNMGDDADTVGAVYGGLAGAYYGVEQVRWRDELQKRELVDSVIEEFAEKVPKDTRT